MITVHVVISFLKNKGDVARDCSDMKKERTRGQC